MLESDTICDLGLLSLTYCTLRDGGRPGGCNNSINVKPMVKRDIATKLGVNLSIITIFVLLRSSYSTLRGGGGLGDGENINL